MRRIVLPGEREPGLEVLVPRDYAEDPAFVCRVPVGEEDMCGKVFYRHERAAFERHVGECARANMDAIHARSPRARMPVFDEENWDPEAAAYLKRVGERMLREGRLVTKKNERLDG